MQVRVGGDVQAVVDVPSEDPSDHGAVGLSVSDQAGDTAPVRIGHREVLRGSGGQAEGHPTIIAQWT